MGTMLDATVDVPVPVETSKVFSLCSHMCRFSFVIIFLANVLLSVLGCGPMLILLYQQGIDYNHSLLLVYVFCVNDLKMIAE